MVAAASLNWDPLVSIVAELMHAQIAIPAASVKNDPESVRNLLPN